jgi:hypothetical protein
MNTKQKPLSIVLLMALITTFIISFTGIANSVDYDYVHPSFNDSNNNNDDSENIDERVTYYDYNDLGIEDPYEVGWD